MNPKFHDYFMHVAKITAGLSYARRLQVGCVAVLDRRIICCGYNGTGQGEDNNCEDEISPGVLVTKPGVFHAEINMINFARLWEIDLFGSHLYITHEPCEPCALQVIGAGIVAVIADIPYTGSNKNGREVLGDRLTFYKDLK
jgi:dCMP deaminase